MPDPTQALEPFKFDGWQVRVEMLDGVPWFVAADVCAALDIASVARAVSRLDKADVRQAHISSVGQRRSMTVINESGLYELVIRSDKPEAARFRRWITSEVLPQIRQTGTYGQSEALDEIETARRYLASLERERALKLELERNAPKVNYVESFVRPSEDATLLDVLAAQLLIRPGVLRKLLNDKRVIKRILVGHRSNGAPEYEWHPASRAGKGWLELRDQATAPRRHNGQVRQTLYVLPPGKVAIKELVEKHQQKEIQA